MDDPGAAFMAPVNVESQQLCPSSLLCSSLLGGLRKKKNPHHGEGGKN